MFLEFARLGVTVLGIEEASDSGSRIRMLPTREMVGLPMLAMAIWTRSRCVLAFGLKTISRLLLIVRCTVKVRSNEKGIRKE